MKSKRKDIHSAIPSKVSASPGQACDHPGCLSHVTHPCEGCGRIAGRGYYLASQPIIPVDLQDIRRWADNRSFDGLCRLADQYLSETEAYDRTVCTGPIEHGGIRPASSEEFSLISRNASRVYEKLAELAEALGYHRKDLRYAIREQERYLK
jgi:hypothetical protein